MTNRLEINWKLDGVVDEQRYYYSETPIDVNQLPLAKAILAGDSRKYIDQDIEIGRKRYILLSSIKNSVEKFSDGSSTYSLPIDPSLWSEFKENLYDDFGLIWTPINGASISNKSLRLIRSNNQRLESNYSTKFHFSNSEDVTIRAVAKVNSFSSDRRVLITTRRDTNYANNWCIYVNPTSIQFYIWDGIGNEIVNLLVQNAIVFGQKFEISLERKSMTWRLYINGSFVGSEMVQNANYTPYENSKITIGSEYNTDSSNNLSRDLDGEISMLQIFKGFAIGDGNQTTSLIE